VAWVFALLGLLFAFAFHGAWGRFDLRRQLIVEEANTISTAWLRIDLLPEEAQPPMRDLFRRYLDSRLETYRKIPDMAAVEAELERTAQVQREIWSATIAAEKERGQVIVMGLLPLLNQMFDIVTTRTVAAKTHPPALIFLMLGFLSCAAAFFAGHGMAGKSGDGWIYSLGFAVILAATLYVIMDLEYPRLGMIRIDVYDEVLIDLRREMD
jgi:hypothetical protein